MTHDDADQLDDLDRALLARLQVDGRENNRSLAKALGANEVTVAARIRRMEENAFMRVVAVADMRMFGHREFAFALMKTTGRSALDIASDVAKLPESIAVLVTTGRYDLIAPILGRDHRHLAELFGETLPLIPGVDDVHGLLVLYVVKFDSAWAQLSVDPGTTPDAVPTSKVDELDLQIITLLQRDARRSNRSIAADLDVSEGTIRVRIKNLLAEKVIKIQAVSDTGAFGIGAFAFFGVTACNGRIDDVAKALAARSDVPQLSRTLGVFDFIAVAMAPSRGELVSALLQEVALIPGVRKIEIFEAFATTKHTYEWSWLV
ncbi:Lrp/AsnC family transcriptional regulator [Nocardia asteroides]|uniref:Lrp/AsnC family transcriptional regulator n=1 Tax=Nocardia asteroides TaxID=1824 RepID=UPI001E3F3A79|nr:Lrp/AsnC family transcriptional regulator [Nocardia asteroides]UGT55095.1 Lrp/AsnC family transcriptional regulator [Nocardia asteroides]